MEIYVVACLWSICLCCWGSSWSNASESKFKAGSATLRQEHLLRHLSQYEIDYPTETTHNGRFIRHVTSPDHGRRRRRSLRIPEGPVYYRVRYRGENYHMKLKLNEKLFGKNFTLERHKKGGRVERTNFIEHCYLIGETTVTNLNAAISDCDGLSGVIETPDDVIYIEPIINDTAIKTKRKGKPHLIYKQSHLQNIKDVAYDMEGDHWSPLFSPGQSAPKKFIFRGAKAFIKIINQAQRPVKVYYLDGDEEKLFSSFPINDEQGINTFTSHRWSARDALSNKLLWIDGVKIFAPTANSEYDRTVIYITIPKGLKLPDYLKPDPPDSFLKIINRSGRFVQIYYQDSWDSQQQHFSTIQPGGTLAISTYTAHRWYAYDYDTGKQLWMNTRYKFLPIRSDRYNRIKVLVTVPINLKLPKVVYPSMLDQDPKYIEAMATADASVVKYHGKDKVERYILTLMNIVSRIFQHKSLGVRIVFVITRLMILEVDPKEIEITTSPMDSLNKVCDWGHKKRKGWDKTDADFHDQTIFITRNNFGPSGYAPVSSMCYRTRSCTLNDDDGFPSSFIIAHETGHTLGMEHDGTHNNCSKDVVKGSVMAPLVRSRFDRFYWSSCSRRELIDHLDHLWCLDDIPFNSNRSLMNKLPGQIYNMNDQCVLDFGTGYSSCVVYSSNKCDKLWCDDNSFSWCRTRNTPPLEGTTCGNRKWCRHGKCLPMTKDGLFEVPTLKPTPKPVNGGWSSWSTFGPCSMTCGQAIMIRARACNQPKPRHNGKPCEGKYMENAFCNVKPCKGIPPPFEQIRRAQCLRRGKHSEWLFYDIYNVNLDCDFENGLCGWEQDPTDDLDWTPNKGQTPSSKTGPTFDHTKGPSEVGTYLFIETSRPTDVGWKARLISKLVAKHVTCLSFWYHSFGDDDHFGHFEVLINTTKKEKVIWGQSGNKGDKWLQKHMTILSVMPYRIVMQAIRGDGYRADIAIDDIKFTEGPCKLGISPPLEENKIPLDLCLSYCISNKTQKISQTRVKDGVHCHENPGILDVCVKGQCQVVGCDGKIGSKVMFDNCGICDGNNDTCTINKGTVSLKPDQDERIILKCPVGASNIMVQKLSGHLPLLVVESAGQVHETFINGGSNMSQPGVYRIGGTEFFYSRNRNSEKILALGPIKEWIVFKLKKLKSGETLKPTSVKFQFYKPNKDPVIYVWRSLGWSNCTKPCGKGTQDRILECRRQKDSSKVKLKYCFGITKPKPLRKRCNMAPCQIIFKWKANKWGPCSVTCSEGTRKRRVICKRSTYGEKTRHVLGSNCKHKKPPTTEKCVKKECEAMWIAGPWGECSKTCGLGVRSRTVKCLSKKGRQSWKCTRDSKLPTKGPCKMIRCVPDAPIVLGNLSCTFEAGFCRWRNIHGKEDNFDWRMKSGATLSRYTGPYNDHTFRSKKGSYMYIEASAPQARGHKAKLISPVIEISKLCLEFYFHMLGDKMGTVNVFLRTAKGDKRLWHKKNNQGGSWNLVRLQITSSVSYRIIFEGIRGNGYASDAAIDDITVYQGKCPTTKYVKTECYGDISRYCILAVHYKWCSSMTWGQHLCCASCSKEVKYRQRRKIPRNSG